MSDYRETELKLYVPDLDAVRRRLEAAGATLKKPRLYERNVRYDNAQGTLTPAGVVLRLRQDDRVRLTYKDGGEITSGDVHSRFEAEVEVSDFDAIHTILVKLGYRPYMLYEKYRTTYELAGVEIALDEMPFGNFVELEGDPNAIRQAQNRLGLQDAPNFHAGYGVLFDRVKRRLNLDFDNLTFANFNGIDVPESAFRA